MFRLLIIYIFLTLFLKFCYDSYAKSNNEMIFISDIQDPSEYEYILFNNNNNSRAIQILLEDIVSRKPNSVFLLGDIVSFGYYGYLWKPIDIFLNKLKYQKTPYYALLGNHEYTIYPNEGLIEFLKRFPNNYPYGYSIVIDSVAVVMLNSNFNQMNSNEYEQQLTFYKAVIDSLENSKGILSIIVACHHSPFTNSSIVKASKEVENIFVPVFEKSKKARIFLSGHSHNLELFRKNNKSYVVIGGGGGSTQPLKSSSDSFSETVYLKHNLRYFYLIINRNKNELLVKVKGLPDDLSDLQEHRFLKIKLDLER